MLFCVKTPINKLYVFAMALLLAAALAGCGGSGGGTTKTPDPPTMPEPTPQERCETAGGRWNADMTCTSAADLEQERMAMAAAATKAAGTKEAAIAAELAENTRGTNAFNAGLGGTNENGTPGDTSDDIEVTTYSLAIERDRDGMTVTITDTANPAGATPPNPQFAKTGDLRASNGFAGSMHARKMAADDDGNVMEEVVVVGTDVEAPKLTEFAKVAGQALNARDLDPNVDADGDGTNNNDYTALTVVNTAAVRALVKASRFESSAQAQLTFDADDASTTGEDEAAMVVGTYNGAMGTYRCNGTAACTVNIDAMGEISAIGSGWVFIPAANAKSPVPDPDFSHYGFWLKKTTDKDGVVTYNEVETFAGSSAPASGDVTSVPGTATYEGGAVGVYVKNVYNSDRTINTATSGHFKADVSLMVTFGQLNDDAGEGTIAPNLLNTLSGTIDNFMLSGSEENDWEVALQGAITEAAGTAEGTAKGGDGDGLFSATFHGDVTAVGGVVPHPGSVVGEFNAEFTDGSVAGAFGASKVME